MCIFLGPQHPDCGNPCTDGAVFVPCPDGKDTKDGCEKSKKNLDKEIEDTEVGSSPKNPLPIVVKAAKGFKCRFHYNCPYHM